MLRNFSYVYSSGGVPCRITHGNVKLSLKWDREPKFIELDPLLPICFEGLLETQHPYNFTSRQCIKELLAAEGSTEKVIPLLSKIIVSMRSAFVAKVEFVDNLTILGLLSNCVKEHLNPYLHLILQQLNKNGMLQ